MSSTCITVKVHAVILLLLLSSQVISRMLSLPEAYWKRVLTGPTRETSASTSKSHSLDDVHGGSLREHWSYHWSG